MYLNYNGLSTLRYKLNPVNLDEDVKQITYNLNDSVDLKNTILDSGNFTIPNFEVKEKYKLEYQYCIDNNECLKSYEYLLPTLGNNDKAILKINGNISINNKSINTLSKFINKFGRVVYYKDSKQYSSKVSLKSLTPNKVKDKDYYFEVDKGVINSDSIYLVFKIRNIQINYKIK